MPSATLSLLKLQLNIDHDLDDELLTHKLEAAIEWVRNHTGYPGDEFCVNEIEAILQLASYWYAQREAASFGVSIQAVPFGIHELLSSNRETCTGTTNTHPYFNRLY